jgi:hypothetical protein
MNEDKAVGKDIRQGKDMVEGKDTAEGEDAEMDIDPGEGGKVTGEGVGNSNNEHDL